MDQDDINYRILRKIQQQEKASPLITKIDRKFYRKFSKHLKDLQRTAEKEDDANKLRLFDAEIQNTKKIAFTIYELREKKIMQAALSKVRGGKPDLRNLLEIEKRLFDSLVDQTNISRREISENGVEKKTDDKIINKIKRKTDNAGQPLEKGDCWLFCVNCSKTVIHKKEDGVWFCSDCDNSFRVKRERKQTGKLIDKNYSLNNKITDIVKRQYSINFDVREINDINLLLNKYYMTAISSNNLSDLIQAIFEKYNHGNACRNRFYAYVKYFVKTKQLEFVRSGNSASYKITRDVRIPK